MAVEAPFNFVPLSDRVYLPDWADQISHDIPFSDGVSGVIKLTITTESDLFIRNGQTKEAEDNRFSRVKGRSFIPATSIKGEVRSLLEIMSFGKMSVDPRTKFAQREWDNRELYTIKKKQSTLQCGYLRLSNGRYEIEDHGQPFRISHKEIDKLLGRKVMEEHFSEHSEIDLNKKVAEGVNGGTTYDPKTAAYKYHLLEGEKLDGLSFSSVKGGNGRRVVYSERGSKRGDIVLTGQPDKWKEERARNAGKYYEFVFPSGVKRTYPLTTEELEHYEFIYQDSDDWTHWKPQLREGAKGIPVFFRTDEGQVKDFGLALLYKLPYDNTPADLLPEGHRETKPDLAECLFGYTRQTDSLKGRVHFGNAFSDNAQSGDEVTLVLASPKASYYPIYIEQQGAQGKTLDYKTYNDGRLAGWKRYHVRDDLWQAKTGSADTDSTLTPIRKGATFCGDVVFHNLRPIELGALLSALTFHGSDGCYHQLGQGKSYGYGRCRYEVQLTGEELREAGYYMGLFELEMDKSLESLGPWISTQQMRELFAISGTPVSRDSHHYMKLSVSPNVNDFADAKKSKSYLRRYSEEVTPAIPKSLSEGVREQEERKRLDRLTEQCEALLQEADTLDPAAGEEKLTEVIKSLRDDLDHPAVQALSERMQAKCEELRQRQEQQEREERASAAYTKGLAATLSPNNSWKANLHAIKKWLTLTAEREGRDTLNSEELRLVIDTFRQIYDGAKKRDKKEWHGDGIRRELAKVLGETQMQQIFDSLRIE